jgi:hypothetical protein
MTRDASTPSALRMRRSRTRRRTGRRVYRVEADEVALETVLSDLGHLRPDDADDPHAVEAALERLLERLMQAWARDA